MLGSADFPGRVTPNATVAASVVAALFMDEREHDMPRVAVPRAEVHLVARFGPSARAGLDVHAVGAQRTVRRKTLRRGQRTVMARLQLGAPEAVLGVPAPILTERIVALEDLWGAAATRRLSDRLAEARDTAGAAAILESAIVERLAPAARSASHARLVTHAADRLTRTGVNAVATELGVSERHLRRVFHETVGVSPKTFAKLARFQHAIGAARADGPVNWASIAAAAGYYDQAHLIAEFRAVAGATPRAFLLELRAAQSLG